MEDAEKASESLQAAFKKHMWPKCQHANNIGPNSPRHEKNERTGEITLGTHMAKPREIHDRASSGI